MMKDALSKQLARGARMALLIALCGALSLMGEARAAAATLAEYRERVRSSLVALDALAALCEELKNGERYEVWSKSSEEEKDRALTLPDMEKKTLATVRQALPAADKVEWNGASVVVNNAWLHTALDEYAKQSATQSDNGKRAMMARAIADRLRALDARLAEAAGARGTAARDKDAEKGRLATILRGKEYAREANEGGAIQRLIKQITDWLSDLFPDIKPIQPGGMGRPSRAAEYIIFALALAAIAFIIWKYWLRRRDRVASVAPRAARVVLGERIAPDETATDLLHQAELLAREGELRGAIRKAYVALLCELGDRKIISLAQHKTNRDYLRAVRKGAPAQLYEEMRPLTVNFERHWYGLEEADQQDWADFRARCRQALKLK
jgi:hypothetical protein